MPELPEVETIRRQLDEVLPGQVIHGIEVFRSKSFIGQPQMVVGKKLLSVERRAKVLRFNLEGDLNLLVHLKMTGQLIYVSSNPMTAAHRTDARLTQDDKFDINSLSSLSTSRIVGGHPSIDWIGKLPSSHTRVLLSFDQGKLFFNDQRVFGWVKVVRDEDIEREHLHFGPDIIDQQLVTSDYFYGHLQRSNAPVKVVILDQKRFAGVGNIYANDGLFDAKINPARSARSLSKTEAVRLLTSLRAVMEKGILLGGASETNFLHVNGMGGKYQEHFLTYKKQGQRCVRKGCEGEIQKISLGGRGTYFCPVCQK